MQTLNKLNNPLKKTKKKHEKITEYNANVCPDMGLYPPIPLSR